MGEIGGEFRGQCVLIGLSRDAYGNAIDGLGNIVYLSQYNVISLDCHHNQWNFPVNRCKNKVKKALFGLFSQGPF
jgi:hypothetical protein